MERLHPFGLTLEAPSSVPVDSWERAARVVHEQYRLITRENQQLDPSKPSHQPWEQLEPLLRETNIRQVTTALAAAESLGRSWGPVVSGVTADGLVTSTEVSASGSGRHGQDRTRVVDAALAGQWLALRCGAR